MNLFFLYSPHLILSLFYLKKKLPPPLALNRALKQLHLDFSACSYGALLNAPLQLKAWPPLGDGIHKALMTGELSATKFHQLRKGLDRSSQYLEKRRQVFLLFGGRIIIVTMSSLSLCLLLEKHQLAMISMQLAAASFLNLIFWAVTISHIVPGCWLWRKGLSQEGQRWALSILNSHPDDNPPQIQALFTTQALTGVDLSTEITQALNSWSTEKFTSLRQQLSVCLDYFPLIEILALAPIPAGMLLPYFDTMSF